MFPQLFILGFLHVLQPGHGQLLLFTSLTFQNLTFSKILKWSILFGILHSFLLFSLAFFVQSFFQNYHNTFHDFELIFALLIISIGIYLTYKYFVNRSTECNHFENNNSSRFILFPILMASIVPCPSNITFLLTSLTHHQLSELWIGLIFYILGITVALFALTFLIYIYGQNFIQKYVFKNSKIAHLLTGIIIILMGILLLIELTIYPHSHH